jgi:hypothetical protein
MEEYIYAFILETHSANSAIYSNPCGVINPQITSSLPSEMQHEVSSWLDT